LFIGLIIALLTISTYVYLAFVVVVLPFILFPVTNIGTMIATILVIMIGLCAIIGSIIALVYGVNWSMEYLYHRNQANQGRPPGLFGLMIAYLMAVKQHFCPIIIFEQDDADGHA
jgi:hypothetical protein